jgi:drug/metabolite transporter (DMT)-like permease
MLNGKVQVKLTGTLTRPARAEGSRAAAVKQRFNSNRVLIVLALLAVYIIWGSTYLAIRVTLDGGFTPFFMAGVRFLIAGGLLLLFLRLRGTPLPTWRQWGASALVGLLLLVGGNGGVTFAEQSVSSSLAALGVAIMPLFAALFAGIWGRWPTRIEWIGLAIGFAGVVLLNMESDLRASPLGAVLLLMAPISWAFGSVISGRMSLPSGLMASAAEMLTGGVVLFGLSLATGERMVQTPTVDALWALAYLVVFGSIVAFSGYLFLLKHVRPSLATSYAYVNPVVAVALGVGLYGETITSVGIAAMLAIVAGVALVVMARSKG